MLTDMLEVRILPGEPNPFHSVTCRRGSSSFVRNVITPSGCSRRRTISILRNPNVFEKKIIGNVPTIWFVTECLSIGCQGCNQAATVSSSRPGFRCGLAHTRFSLIRNFKASSSSLVMPCRAIAVARCKAGTCFILLPRATVRRSFCTSGSAPTVKNTS